MVDGGTEPLNIPVPSGDVYFDPNGTGTVVIEMSRSAYDPATGTDPSNPRAFPNGISSFVDASGVYGSDEEKANWLRTFEGGKLKTSAGDLLPYNTTTGEYDAVVDPNAPEMAMPNPSLTKWFVAGDVRANENICLTSCHTLFVREHNRLCDELAGANPTWTDEQLYQHARKIVGGLVQAIVYEEWLPTLGVHMEEYTGHDPTLETGIYNVFSASAYRYGHSVINSNIVRLNNDGGVISQGNILLRDAFFNPPVLVDGGGIDPLLKGMATQVEQDFDAKMIHDLRNFLFGPPGSGGLDLASLNINRGRERGLPDYNTARVDFGLPHVDSFDDMTSNSELNNLLEIVYGDVDNIDSWVGFLAEDHMSTTLFGMTVMTIMDRQFTLLRDGDRFYYENDPWLSLEEKEEIKNTRMVDIILRNSGALHLQDNVFLARIHTATNEVETQAVEMTVYPNPASDNFFINVATIHRGEAFVQITDLLGHVVLEKTLDMTETHNFELHLDSYLPNGIYNLILRTGNQVGHQKIIKR